MIKERVRAIINTVPFSLSELLESWLLRYVVNRLNLVPTRNSVAYVSPREKLYGRKINVDKELKHGFGDYVQVHTNSVDNSTKPRSQAAIALVSAGNLEGSWYYLCGDTGYTGPTGRTGPRHDPPDPSAYTTHTALPRLAS